MTPITINIEVGAGESIQQVARHMVYLASITRCGVRGKFNDRVLFVRPFDTEKQIVDRYFSAIEQEGHKSKEER